MNGQDQSHIRCKQCCNDIPRGARLCSYCSSYQDWRSWFSVSSTVLAMLTALVSVLGIATPAVINVLHSPKSDAILQTPSLDGTTLRVVAINRGDAPASLIRARIDGDYLAGATKVRLRNDGDASISPGSKLLTFDIIPLLDEGQSYEGSLQAMTAAMSGKPLPATSVLLGLAQSDGGVSVLTNPTSRTAALETAPLRTDARQVVHQQNPQLARPNPVSGLGLSPRTSGSGMADLPRCAGCTRRLRQRRPADAGVNPLL
jgi:hypothetical protein